MNHYKGMKRSHKIIIGLVFLFAMVMILLPQYAIRALWHGEPNIDDYKIFYNRVIEAGESQPWEIAHDYNRSKLPDDITEDIAGYDPARRWAVFQFPESDAPGIPLEYHRLRGCPP